MNEKKKGKPEEQRNAIGGVTFLAKPEALIAQASLLSARIAEAETSIQSMEELIGRTNLYWLGEAAAAHRNASREKRQASEQTISGLYRQIENLLKIAGVYQEAESAADNEALALPEDVLQ